MKIAVVSIRHQLTPEQLGSDPKGTEAFAKATVEAPGFVWKIWTFDHSHGKIGGIYLFESEDNAKAYFDGPVFAPVRSNPGFQSVDIEYLDVNENPSLLTNAPIPVRT